MGQPDLNVPQARLTGTDLSLLLASLCEHMDTGASRLFYVKLHDKHFFSLMRTFYRIVTIFLLILSNETFCSLPRK